MTMSGNFNTTTAESHTGLFSSAANAQIRNLGLEDININISGGRHVGGIVGSTINSVVSNCYTTGKITSTFFQTAGIVGNDFGGTIVDCYNTADISGRSSAGGIVARTEGSNVNGPFTTIRNCFNTGTIYANSPGQNPACAGGIVGSAGNSIISNCFNSGSSSARIADTVDNRPRAGGIIGSSWSGSSVISIADCYNSMVNYFSPISGVVGTRQTIENSYGITSKSGDLVWVVGNETLTTEQMRQQSTFADFDFENTWTFIDGVNNGMPVLRVFHDVPPADCTCRSCPDCGFHGGRFGFGRVTNTGDIPQIDDALTILRYLLGLSSPIRDCNDARAAANIVNPGFGEPQVADALQLLRKIIGLPNMIDNPELRLS